MSSEAERTSKISVIGIDLDKYTFHVYGVDGHGQRMVQKKFSRAKLLEFMTRLEVDLLGLKGHFPKINGSHLELDAPGGEPLHIQDVIDQIDQPFAVAGRRS